MFLNILYFMILCDWPMKCAVALLTFFVVIIYWVVRIHECKWYIVKPAFIALVMFIVWSLVVWVPFLRDIVVAISICFWPDNFVD
jgi:hypothetical protein